MRLIEVVESVRVRQLNFQPTFDEARCSCQADSSFSQLVSERGGRCYKRAHFELRPDLETSNELEHF